LFDCHEFLIEERSKSNEELGFSQGMIFKVFWDLNYVKPQLFYFFNVVCGFSVNGIGKDNIGLQL